MEEYVSNISIGGYTIGSNPESYSKTPMKMGSFSRTTMGSLISQDVSANKFQFRISSKAQSDIEALKNVAAAEHNLELVDFIPISERGAISRSVYELLETTTVNGETIYRYIPTYVVSIISFVPVYGGNIVEYTIEAEEM